MLPKVLENEIDAPFRDGINDNDARLLARTRMRCRYGPHGRRIRGRASSRYNECPSSLADFRPRGPRAADGSSELASPNPASSRPCGSTSPCGGRETPGMVLSSSVVPPRGCFCFHPHWRIRAGKPQGASCPVTSLNAGRVRTWGQTINIWPIFSHIAPSKGSKRVDAWFLRRMHPRPCTGRSVVCTKDGQSFCSSGSSRSEKSPDPNRFGPAEPLQ